MNQSAKHSVVTQPGQWVAPAQADLVIRDAVALATFAVASPDLRDVTRKEVLSKYILILLTHGTSNGKYDTRYRSAGALEVADPTHLEHEHVFPRKWLIERMLETPDAVEFILTTYAIACTVTSSEHKALAAAERAHPDAEGWDRYHAARIRVFDMETGDVVPQSIGENPPPPHAYLIG